MDDRDDDDNESAVRALNTAMTRQAQSLKILQDDPLLTERKPYDEDSPTRNSSTTGPSDETISFLDPVSASDTTSSDVLGASIVGNDPPGALVVGGGDDSSEDDGIGDEVKNLWVSEVLLRQEMERASQVASKSSLEQLSSDLLEATEQICSPNDKASVDEIRAHMAREKIKKEQTKNGTVGGCTTTIQNVDDLGCVKELVESVMDTVLCKGYPEDGKNGTTQKQGGDTSKEVDGNNKKPLPVLTSRSVPATARSARQSGLQRKSSTSPGLPPLANRSSSMALTDKEKAFVARELRNARSVAARHRYRLETDEGESTTSPSLSQSISTADTSGRRGGRTVVNRDSRKQSFGSTDTPIRRGAGNTKPKIISDDNQSKSRSISEWTAKSRNRSISEASTTRSISEWTAKSRNTKSISEASTVSKSSKSTAKRPSLMENLKSLSARKVDSSQEEQPKNDVTVCVSVGKSAVLTPVEELTRSDSKRSLLDWVKGWSTSQQYTGGTMSEVSTASKPESSRSATSRYDFDQEATTPLEVHSVEEEGHEVEAFYQAKHRMSLIERARSPEQHREWKKELFKRGWLGMRQIYWVLLILLTVNLLLLGIILLVTEASDEKASSQSVPVTLPELPKPGRPNMDVEMAAIFPMRTHEAMKDLSSPQSKAYDWLLNDPNFHLYSFERKLQRFALAALYYSTNGEEWTFANRVLTYDSDECQWFYSRTARSTPAACAVAGGVIDSLMLDHNNLVGTLPPEIWLLTNLKSISLANNQLSSTIPSEGLEMLTDLQFFGMTKSGLMGPIPDTLGYLENLELLDLSANQFTGTIPISFRNLASLRELRLHKNHLSGTLPGTVLAGLSNLQQLYLFENKMTGAIPPEVQYLTFVEDLFLYSNGFSSSLPTELGYMTRVQRLWLDRNRFTGQIPVQLGRLHMMVQLSLYSNELSGTIPASLGNARSLEQVRLGDNLLTGQVPDPVCYLFSPTGADSGIVKMLSLDCNEVACDCNCNCPRPGSEADHNLP